MNAISASQMSALTAMAASLEQQQAILPLLQGLAPPPVAPPPPPTPGVGATVDVRA